MSEGWVCYLVLLGEAEAGSAEVQLTADSPVCGALRTLVDRRRSNLAAGCFLRRPVSRKTSDIAAMPSKPRDLNSSH